MHKKSRPIFTGIAIACAFIGLIGWAFFGWEF